jgi:hypothetical protein
MSELSHEFFGAFENTHATEHKRFFTLWQALTSQRVTEAL